MRKEERLFAALGVIAFLVDPEGKFRNIPLLGGNLQIPEFFWFIGIPGQRALPFIRYGQDVFCAGGIRRDVRPHCFRGYPWP